MGRQFVFGTSKSCMSIYHMSFSLLGKWSRWLFLWIHHSWSNCYPNKVQHPCTWHMSHNSQTRDEWWCPRDLIFMINLEFVRCSKGTEFIGLHFLFLTIAQWIWSWFSSMPSNSRYGANNNSGSSQQAEEAKDKLHEQSALLDNPRSRTAIFFTFLLLLPKEKYSRIATNIVERGLNLFTDTGPFCFC